MVLLFIVCDIEKKVENTEKREGKYGPLSNLFFIILMEARYTCI